MKNLDYYRNPKGQIWLNVASSSHVLEEFVNLDNHIFLRMLKIYPLFRRIIPKKYCELAHQYREAMRIALLVRHDCRKPLFFPDNSVDHILCSHFLEHVFPFEMEIIIQDFFRVLKNGATLHVIVPDLKKHVDKYLINYSNEQPRAADEFIKETILSRETRGSSKYRLLEFTGGFGLQHHWMYDHYSMASRLEDIGFEILDKNETPSKYYRLNDDSVHLVGCKR